MNSFIISFETSVPRVVGHIVLFLCFSFAVQSTMVSLLLNDVVRDRESIQSPFVKVLAGCAFNQKEETMELFHTPTEGSADYNYYHYYFLFLKKYEEVEFRSGRCVKV